MFRKNKHSGADQDDRIAATVYLAPYVIFLFGGGLILIGVAVSQYLNQRKIVWKETTASLIKTRVDERLRNKKEEQILALTYQYRVNGIQYDAYTEEIIVNDWQVKSLEVEIQETRSTVPLYYQIENPEESTFNVKDIKPNDGLLKVALPTSILILLIGFWLFRIWYKYVF